MATLWKRVAEPRGNPPGSPHACRTRTPRMPAKTPLAGDKMDAPAVCAVPFRPYCGGVVTRTRNVSEYMLLLALCLVAFCYNNAPFRSVPGYIGRRRFVKVSLFHSSSYNRSPSPSRYGILYGYSKFIYEYRRIFVVVIYRYNSTLCGCDLSSYITLESPRSKSHRPRLQHKFSPDCYLLAVYNSGLLFSHGQPSQQLLSSCSHVTLNFDLCP